MAAKRKPAKKKPAKRASVTQSKKQVSAAKRRSAAAKKGWETRKKNAAEAKREREKLRLRRSAASKKGWETRKKKAAEERRDKQYDERAPLLERKDLRRVLPAKLQKMAEHSSKTLEETKVKLVKEDRKRISGLSFVDLLKEIRSPRLRLEAEYSGSLKAAMKIARLDIDAYWDVQIEKMRRRQQTSQNTVIKFFERNIYGTELEAYHMVDDTFRILTTQYDAEETNESKLRRQLNEAVSAPQFDAIMEVQASELNVSKRALYKWFNGSPDADFFI